MSAANLSWAALYFTVPVVGVIVGRSYNARKHGSKENPFEGQSVLFSIGVVLLLLTLWPLVILGFALDPWITNYGYWMDRRRNRFHCRPEHLLGSLTVRDAEVSAKVVDPLHRAPGVPFGHLNLAWRAFLAKKKFGYRLKAFCIPGTAADALHAGAPRWSTPKGRKLGYAWVGLRSVKGEFIYEWD
jgi:hypothetical protein